MNYYFAPLEGITGYIFRNTFEEYFGGIDKWFTAFLSPNQQGGLRTREIEDVLPEHNTGIALVPQILSNHAPSFLMTANRLYEQGYEEINLNLGCPSGTVTAKGKGAGFLGRPQELERFLETIFQGFPGKISIKTRLGVRDTEEFPHLLELYNQYPVSELIIHARVQKDFYKNTPHWDMIAYAEQHANMPICYNGDLFTPQDLRSFHERFPSLDTVMLGRGLLADPCLLLRMEGKEQPYIQKIADFHTALLDRYQKVMPGDRALLFRMKEHWVYLGCLFADCGKQLKRIRKAQSCADYRKAADDLFSQCEVLPASVFHG